MNEPSERDKQRARSICGCYRHEEIARAIVSAREEANAAGFERGRRSGMEEAQAKIGAMIGMEPWAARRATLVTCRDAIRALIGGAP